MHGRTWIVRSSLGRGASVVGWWGSAGHCGGLGWLDVGYRVSNEFAEAYFLGGGFFERLNCGH